MNKFAAIDIGTNTILMLIAEKQDGCSLKILRDDHSIARLGEKVGKTGIISQIAVQRAEEILTYYKSLCDSLGIQNISAVGTSCMRDAINSEDVRRHFEDILSAEIKVISGEEESRLTFLGTVESDNSCTVIDIGGGSTEFISGVNQTIFARKSLQIGAVRLTERYFSEFPATSSHLADAKEEIRKNLKTLPAEISGTLIGVAGTPTSLAAIDLNVQKFETEKIHGYILPFERVREISEKLLAMSMEEIMKNPSISPKRADILPMGSLILLESMKYLCADSCTVSTKGLRYGVLSEMASGC